MIKINEYMGGKVKSLGTDLDGIRFTAGVMLPGEYKFSTDAEEHITVTLGELDIQIPGANWKKISKGETAVVPSKVEFSLRNEKTASYICIFK